MMNIGTLSAISANLGTVKAGTLTDPAGTRMVIDLNNGFIDIFDNSSTRRARLGTQADGSIALRVSAPAFDALTAIDDGHSLTFNSRWTDIAKIVAIGIVTETVVNVITGTNVFGVRAFYPDQGFKPFIEIRLLSGNVVFDDFVNSTFPAGGYTLIERTQATMSAGKVRPTTA